MQIHPTLKTLYLILCLHWTDGTAIATETWFTELTGADAPDFIHFNGMSGEYYFVEMTGQGGALLDYDNDGDLDLYLVQGAMLGNGKTYQQALPPPRRIPPMDRLYRNDLSMDPNGKAHPHFVDVTEQSGIRATGYGMGVAVGDIDQDGQVDLYVTQYGANLMLKNNGDGSFSDISATSGTAGKEVWSTSAAFLDYDRDGLPDLYVANYVDYSVDDNKRCYSRSSSRDYCGPSAFTPVHDRLYHNLGGGRFEEISDRLLIDYKSGPGLGVIGADLNADGWTDIYVANDGGANQYWINRQGRDFTDDALFSGAAVNRAGRAEASMGVDAGDFDNDGDTDLFVAHLMGETNTLYVNDGQGLFEDQTIARGLAAGSFPYTAFGVGWLDADNDGWLDLLILNGAVQVIRQQAQAGVPYPLRQPNQLFISRQGKEFEEVHYAKGSPLKREDVSRGAAFGDLDNDGDTDAVVFNNSGPVQVLINTRGQNRAWLGLRLWDKDGRADPIGTRVALQRPARKTLWRRGRRDGSYCSANDPRILFGLGRGKGGPRLRIQWPDGSTSDLKAPPINRYIDIRQAMSTPDKGNPTP